ncbi:MAG: ABC transporter substrate-binding protein, partial [Mycobacterium sp.]
MMRIRTMKGWLATSCTTLGAVLVLAGCGQPEFVTTTAVPTLPPPTPAGMQELPPEPPRPPKQAADNCDLTASLRPFRTKAEA